MPILNDHVNGVLNLEWQLTNAQLLYKQTEIGNQTIRFELDLDFKHYSIQPYGSSTLYMRSRACGGWRR